MAVRKSLALLNRVLDTGCSIYSTAEGREYSPDTIDDVGDFSLLLLVVSFTRAHQESEHKSERVKAARANKLARIRQGERIIWNKRCPSWLDVVDGWFQVNEDKAGVIRQIFECFDQGTANLAIARQLNEDGIPTFRSGQFWHHTSIRHVLHSESVTGVLIPTQMVKGKKTKLDPVPDYYPRIIDQELWDSVHRKLSSVQARGVSKVVSPLAGLAKCGNCGAALTRLAKSKQKGKMYLVCSGRRNHNGCDQTMIYFPTFWRQLKNILPGILKALPKGKQDDVRQAMASRLHLGTQVAAVLDLLEGEDSVAMRQRLVKLETQLREAQERYDATKASTGPRLVKRRIDRLIGDLENNGYWRDVFKSITIRRHKINQYDLVLDAHHLVKSERVQVLWPYVRN